MRDRKDLLGKNIVVYDCEIKKPIAECKGGWNGFDEMGISVASAFDYRVGRYRIFMDDNIHELAERLNEPDTLVVAFNHLVFDNRLLRGSGLPLKEDDELNNYDMLAVSRRGVGVTPGVRSKGFKLDDHLEALNLPKKTGDGAQAPILWQDKKYGELIDYCLQDVFSERALFEYMYVHGKSACAYTPEPYEIELPIFK